MNVHHTLVNVVEHIIDTAEAVYLDGNPLSNTNGASHSLMNDSGIPMLGQKQYALTELQVQASTATNNLNNNDNSPPLRIRKQTGGLGIGNGQADSIRVHAAANGKDGGTETLCHSGNLIHFGTKVTEDNRTDLFVNSPPHLSDASSPLGGTAPAAPVRARDPVRPAVGSPPKLGAHSLDIDLRMDQKLLYAHP